MYNSGARWRRRNPGARRAPQDNNSSAGKDLTGDDGAVVDGVLGGEHQRGRKLGHGLLDAQCAQRVGQLLRRGNTGFRDDEGSWLDEIAGIEVAQSPADMGAAMQRAIKRAK